MKGCEKGYSCNANSGQCEENSEDYKANMMADFFHETGNPGSFCDDDSKCGSNVCEKFRCKGKGKGEACAQDLDCDTAFFCSEDKCAPLKRDSMDCASDSECIHGALCNSDDKCASLFSLRPGKEAKTYMLCDSLTVDVDSKCVAPVRRYRERRGREDEAEIETCKYIDTHSDEVFELPNAAPVCAYSEHAMQVCPAKEGDEMVREVVEHARDFIEMIQHHTSCHKAEDEYCGHGANMGFSEDPRPDEEEDDNDSDDDKKHHHGHHALKKQWEMIRGASAIEMLTNLNDLLERATPLTEGRVGECVAWTMDKELAWVLKEEHHGFPWVKMTLGTLALAGAGAGAYYYFFVMNSTP